MRRSSVPRRANRSRSRPIKAARSRGSWLATPPRLVRGLAPPAKGRVGTRDRDDRFSNEMLATSLQSLAPHMSDLIRCPWPPIDDKLYVDYHDREWGVPVRDDRKLFEFIILEVFQAGLSWRTVLYR